MIMGKFLVTVGLSVVCSMAGTLKDSRDGQTYKTVQIGNQVWMAENLNYKTGGSVCYSDDPVNCERYGSLYTWNAAKNACPIGWHLPSKDEFETLLKNVGDSDNERTNNLRVFGWKKGMDKYGFSALPAGSYIHDVDILSLASSRTKSNDKMKFKGLNSTVFFWSSTEDGSGMAHNLRIDGYYAGFGIGYSKDGGFSVRCLQDSYEGGETSSFRSETQSSIDSIDDMTDARDGKTYKTVKIGDQVWMAENLNYSVPDSKCFEYDSKTCTPYGRVYSLKAAQKACPSGWRLPSKIDFEKLLNYVGKNSEERGWNLRKKGEFDGLDKFGFSAHLGFHYFSMGDYDGMRAVSFWSSSKCSPCVDEDYLYRGVYHLYVGEGGAYVDVVDELELENAADIPIRCLRDLSNEEKKNDADQPVAEMSPPVSDNLLVDSRDGEVYKTVQIGNRLWMAENLRYNAPGSQCANNNPELCGFGRFYNLIDNTIQRCPDGWHIPGLPEIACVQAKDGGCVQMEDNQEALAMTVARLSDGVKVGTALKTKTYWKDADGISQGLNSFGFNVDPTGYQEGGNLLDFGGGAYFWTATSDKGAMMLSYPETHILAGKKDENTAYYWYFYNDSEDMGVNTSFKTHYYSIRCIRDEYVQEGVVADVPDIIAPKNAIVELNSSEVREETVAQEESVTKNEPTIASGNQNEEKGKSVEQKKPKKEKNSKKNEKKEKKKQVEMKLKDNADKRSFFEPHFFYGFHLGGGYTGTYANTTTLYVDANGPVEFDPFSGFLGYNLEVGAAFQFHIGGPLGVALEANAHYIGFTKTSDRYHLIATKVNTSHSFLVDVNENMILINLEMPLMLHINPVNSFYLEGGVVINYNFYGGYSLTSADSDVDYDLNVGNWNVRQFGYGAAAGLGYHGEFASAVFDLGVRVVADLTPLENGEPLYIPGDGTIVESIRGPVDTKLFKIQLVYNVYIK